MEKWRRFLVFLFGALSLFFAAIAISQHFEKSGSKSPPQEILRGQWGKNIEAEARRADKPILLVRVPDKLNLVNSGNPILNEFLKVEFNAAAWPADAKIFDSIISNAAIRNGGKACEFSIAVLSPRLSPLFLGTKTIKDSPKKLGAFLSTIAREYAENRNRILDLGRKSVPEFPVKSKLPAAPYISKLLFLNSESMGLYVMMRNPKSISLPAAVLSENARLAMRIASTDIRYQRARAAALAATDIIYLRLKQNPEFSEKVLLARALAESGLFNANKTVSATVRKIADSLLPLQGSEGLFSESGKSAELLPNILAASFLLRAYNLHSSDKELFESAKRCADKLEEILRRRGEMPALPLEKEDSQASALEYAELANLFADFHRITSDEKYLNVAAATLDEMNAYYSSPNGLWYLNSKNSALANFARPMLLTDSNMPSHIGVAAQAILYVREFNPDFCRERMDNILGAIAFARGLSPSSGSTCASLKIGVMR